MHRFGGRRAASAPAAGAVDVDGTAERIHSRTTVSGRVPAPSSQKDSLVVTRSSFTVVPFGERCVPYRFPPLRRMFSRDVTRRPCGANADGRGRGACHGESSAPQSGPSRQRAVAAPAWNAPRAHRQSEQEPLPVDGHLEHIAPVGPPGQAGSAKPPSVQKRSASPRAGCAAQGTPPAPAASSYWRVTLTAGRMCWPKSSTVQNRLSGTRNGRLAAEFADGIGELPGPSA